MCEAQSWAVQLLGLQGHVPKGQSTHTHWQKHHQVNEREKEREREIPSWKPGATGPIERTGEFACRASTGQEPAGTSKRKPPVFCSPGIILAWVWDGPGAFSK